MVRNWMFTLFYCTSELWGDVVLSLLFWGLANETTSLRDAPLLYPLFGVGANVAQTLAGRILSAFSNTTANNLTYAQQVQSCMGMVLALGVGILAMHHYINVRFPHNYGDIPTQVATSSKKLRPLSVSPSMFDDSLDEDSNSSSRSSNDTSSSSSSRSFSSNGSSTSAESNGNNNSVEPSSSEPDRFQTSPAISSNSSNDASTTGTDSSSSNGASKQQGGRSKLGFREAVVFLAKSPQIRCLAMMALAQGLTTNLLDVAWKQHLHMLHPSPAAYSVSCCLCAYLRFMLLSSASKGTLACFASLMLLAIIAAVVLSLLGIMLGHCCELKGSQRLSCQWSTLFLACSALPPRTCSLQCTCIAECCMFAAHHLTWLTDH